MDCVLAVVMTAIGVSSVFTTDDTVAYDYPPADARLVLLAIGAGLPIALRRIYPYTAVLLSVASITPIMALRWNEGVTPLCTLALLYSVAVYRPFRVALAGLATVLGMFGFFALIGAPFFDDAAGHPELGHLLHALGDRPVRTPTTASPRAGDDRRHSRPSASWLPPRSGPSSPSGCASPAELHDVVSHTLSVIAVQSGVARHLAAGASPSGSGRRSRRSRTPAAPRWTTCAGCSACSVRLRARTVDESAEQLCALPGPPRPRALVALHRESHGPVELTIDPAARGTARRASG